MQHQIFSSFSLLLCLLLLIAAPGLTVSPKHSATGVASPGALSTNHSSNVKLARDPKPGDNVKISWQLLSSAEQIKTDPYILRLDNVTAYQVAAKHIDVVSKGEHVVVMNRENSTAEQSTIEFKTIL